MRLVNLQSIMSRRMTAFHASSGVFSSRDVRLTASCGFPTPCPSCKTDLKPPGLSGCEHPQDPLTMLFLQFENRRFRLRTKTQYFTQNFIGSVGKSSLLTAACVGRESYPVPASSGEVAQLLSFEGSHLISTPYDVAGLAWNACQARSFILH